MLCARNKAMAKIMKISTEFNTQLLNKPKGDFFKCIEAYSEGLDRPANDLVFSLLLPEIVASFNKWTPNLMGLIPGCSSLFLKDPKSGDFIHGRILDYALSGPFEDFERSILYEFKNSPKIFSLSTSGMPFPSLSSFNEEGLSLALHYKHGKYFNLEGTSIFEITNDIISNCGNIREALKLIKTKKSISYWGIYLADKQGEVVSIDIKGHEIFQEKFDLNDHKYLYFNNRPLLKQNDSESIQPFGNQNQCKMRRDCLKKELSSKKAFNDKDHLLSTLKVLGNPTCKKTKSAKNWDLSPINPGSLQLYALNISKEKVMAIPGHAPKYFNGEYFSYENLFSEIKFKHKKTKLKKNDKFIKGMKLLSKFQSSFDRGDIENSYHEIQMSLCYLEAYPEYYIAKFYYTILQYLYEGDKRDHTYLYEDFVSLKGKLPDYLNDHLLLFIMRSGKIIGHKNHPNMNEIKHPDLKSYYAQELKLKTAALKGLKHLIFPRIEILDIIYSY